MDKYLLSDKEKIKANYGFNLSKLSPYEIGIPLIDISDKIIEEIYYFRWHTFCKHIKETPEGYVITEFFPDVPWAGKYNAICCPAGHQLYEGRWLYDGKYVNSYSKFWFSPDVCPRDYSGWLTNAICAVSYVSGDYSVAEELFESFKKNYFLWEKEKGIADNVFYQIDDRDGMEFSAGGSGVRPTINSYMYGEARAISNIAKRLGKDDDCRLFAEKAEKIKAFINRELWDEKAEFYKTLNTETGKLVNVRELIGYIPWYFGIPEEKMSTAWKFLNDERHFYAPFGPTTAERCAENFMEKFDHECLWNGPSWPFATSQTLTAMNNLLNNYEQDYVVKSDYYNLLHLFANSHYLTENGKKTPFIDENLDPFSGEWLARKILMQNPPENQPKERGKDYNHSTFCDLVICGLAGIVPAEHNTLTVNPLFCPEDLDYFCADGIKYHNHFITVLWDKNGERYNKGKGFFLFVDGLKAGFSETPSKLYYEIKE